VGRQQIVGHKTTQLHGEQFQDRAVVCLVVGTPAVRKSVFSLARKLTLGNTAA